MGKTAHICPGTEEPPTCSPPTWRGCWPPRICSRTRWSAWTSPPGACLPNPVSPGWSGGSTWPSTTTPPRSSSPGRPAWTPPGRPAGRSCYDILSDLGQINKDTAVPLYVAVSTDTGCFQYSNTTAATHRVAAALMDTGLDVFPLNKRHFRTKTWARLQVERLHHGADAPVRRTARSPWLPCPSPSWMRPGPPRRTWRTSPPSWARSRGWRPPSPSGSWPRGAASCRCAPSAGLNATKVCALLGGGGHAAAAGCNVEGGLKEAEEQILAAIRKVEADG